MKTPRPRLSFLDVRPVVLLNYFLRPVAVSKRFARLHRSVDAFAQSGKAPLKKREPNPVYSEIVFCLGPDSDPVPA
jgi:hypothetical protein